MASRSNFFRWSFFISYCALLYGSSVLPGEQLPKVITYANDRILHFFDYFLLALLAFRTLVLSPHVFFYARASGKAVGFSLLYGAFLEWVQWRVPGRDASFSDWTADALGILVASGIFRISRLTQPS